MPAERGFLLLADITGYTSFLSKTSAEAGSAVAGALLQTLLDTVFPPFKVANIEGDAVFIYAPDDGTATGQTVLDAIDALYCAFTDRVCALKYGAACPNDPRLLAGALDLKLIAHYGEYGVQRLGEREELAGPDVILLHRLAKAERPREQGLTGYALLTHAAVGRMELGTFFQHMQSSVEEVGHLGRVESYVYPLASVWEHRRGVKCYIDRDAALLIEEIAIDLPVPPCRAWELCTEPVHRAKWINGIQKISLGGLEHGRVGEGAVQYCDHGNGVVVPLTVVDWRPFDYISFEIATPLGVAIRQTIELRPVGAGTRVAIRIAKPTARGLLDRWRLRGRVEALRGLFTELYAQATTALPRLAQAA